MANFNVAEKNKDNNAAKVMEICVSRLGMKHCGILQESIRHYYDDNLYIIISICEESVERHRDKRLVCNCFDGYLNCR